MRTSLHDMDQLDQLMEMADCTGDFEIDERPGRFDGTLRVYLDEGRMVPPFLRELRRLGF